MRALLIDWMITAHLKFKLREETLYMAINIMDRYLEADKVSKAKLQLVGVTALIIASKYEEIYAPELRDFITIADNNIKKSEILSMEHLILSRLRFDLVFTSSSRFLDRYMKLAKADETVYNLGKYILETSLLEYKMLKYKPSI